MEKPRYDVFLSHATRDKPVVEDLARRLVLQGLKPWLDKWDLIPGEPWQEAIEKALEDCPACAVCIGPNGFGAWQTEEMNGAIQLQVSRKQKRVIPVVLPGAQRGERSALPLFLQGRTWVDSYGSLDERFLKRLIAGIRGEPPGPDVGEAVAQGTCPYRGLEYFDVGDSAFFHGRETLTGWLLAKLRPTRLDNRFLAIIGPSGSGKSSLARAGLLGSLKNGEIPGSQQWPLVVCKPGAQPLESLAVALRPTDSPAAVREMIQSLGKDSGMLHLTTRLALSNASEDRRFVVLIDQFEEVFTLCADAVERKALIDNLLRAAKAVDGRTAVVLTLRSDFYGRCADYPELAAAISDRNELVGLMTEEELRQSIEEPARLAGFQLQPGLTDLLLGEVLGKTGGLPLLEHALLQIWKERTGMELTVKAYNTIGKVAGALKRHADEIFSQFTVVEQETCRRILLRLVQVNNQGEATKRRRGMGELSAPSDSLEYRQAVTAVVSELTRERLLITEATGEEKLPTVELAHEALVTSWDRLRKWIVDNKEALRVSQRLDEAVKEWLANERDPSFLFRGARLEQAQEWMGQHPGEQSLGTSDFLAESTTAWEYERERDLVQTEALEEEQRRRGDAEYQRAEEQTQARRRQAKWTLIASVAAALAVAAALYTGQLWRTANRRQKIDLASQLADQSRLALNSDPMLGLLLSIKAMRLAEEGGLPHLPSAEAALRSALANSKGLPLLTGKIRAASLSAERRYLALAGTDGAISIWDLAPATGPAKVAAFPVVHSVRQIALGSGSHWVAFADENGDSQLCRPEASRCTSTLDLDGEDWLAGSDPFSPDARWLMTRGKGSRWQLRDLAQLGRSPRVLPDMNLEALAFSSDNSWLATAEPGFLRIWNLESVGDDLRAFQIPLGVDFTSLAFSSDLKWLVAGEKIGAAVSVQAWSLSPVPANDSPMDLDDCKWNMPNGPNLTDPPLISHIGLLANCSIRGGVGAEKITATAQQGTKTAIGFVDGGLLMRSTSLSPGEGFQKGPVKLLALTGQRLTAQSDSEAPRVFDEMLDGLEPATLYRSFALFSPHVLKAFSPVGLKLWRNEADYTLWLEGPHGAWPLQFANGTRDNGDWGIRDDWRFSPDSRWLATLGSNDSTIVVWQLDDQGRPALHPFPLTGPKGHSVRVTTLVFSPDSHWVASGDVAGESRLWNLRLPGREPTALVNHRGPVNALAFNDTAHLLATAGDDGVVRVLEIAEGQAPRISVNSPTNRGEPVIALAFLSEDRLAISSSSRITLWEVGQDDIALESPGDSVSQLLSSPGGAYLAAVANGNVFVWYPRANGDLLPSPVKVTSYSPEVTTERSISFTTKGDRLETYAEGASLESWGLDPGKLLKTACQAAGRNLTEREWKEYIPSYETYQEREPCPEFPKAYD